MTVDPHTALGTDLAQALGELYALALATEDLQEMLQQTARVAASGLGDGISCGITVAPGGRSFTIASSDDRASQVDEMQYADGDGPCLQTLRTGIRTAVPGLTVETRWGDYPAQALAAGVRSSLSLPLTTQNRTLGALNLYSGSIESFPQQREDLAAILAVGATGVIGTALRYAEQVQLTAQLQEALTSRTVIDQAIGIMVRDRRCGPDEAFALLRAASQRRNVKLRVIAEELVRSMARKPRPGEPH